MEAFQSRLSGRETRAAAERARTAAQELSVSRSPVRLLRSMFVPEDETHFLLFEATAVDLVGDVAQRAGIEYERIVEVEQRA